MRKKENQDYDVVPIPWGTIISFIALFGLMWFLFFLRENPDSKTKFFLFMIPVGLAYIVTDLGRNYILTKESITCRIFFIPYRTILWENVIQMGIAVYGTGRYIETRIILTLKGCPKYVPSEERAHTYCKRHPKKTLSVRGPEDRYKYFEKYYGRLDYGYEKLDFMKIFKKNDGTPAREIPCRRC